MKREKYWNRGYLGPFWLILYGCDRIYDRSKRCIDKVHGASTTQGKCLPVEIIGDGHP